MSGCSRWDNDDPSDKEIKDNRKTIADAKKSIHDKVSEFIANGYKGHELRIVIKEHYPEKKIEFYTNEPDKVVIIPEEL